MRGKLEPPAPHLQRLARGLAGRLAHDGALTAPPRGAPDRRDGDGAGIDAAIDAVTEQAIDRTIDRTFVLYRGTGRRGRPVNTDQQATQPMPVMRRSP